MSIDDLVNEVQEITQPDFFRDLTKSKRERAKSLYNHNFSNNETTGIEKVDAFENIAYHYMRGAGFVPDRSDKKVAAFQMRQWLGDDYDSVLGMVGLGDKDGVLNAFNKVHINITHAAYVDSVVQRIEAMNPEDKETFGRRAVGLVNGSNWLEVIQNPRQYIGALTQINEIRNPYM